MSKVELTESQIMLLMLLIETTIKFALRQIQDLSEAEIEQLINDEELRTANLLAQLNKTGG